jgi:hypothetical protein
MPTNAARTIANDDVFCEADVVMDRIKKELAVDDLDDAQRRYSVRGARGQRDERVPFFQLEVSVRGPIVSVPQT